MPHVQITTTTMGFRVATSLKGNIIGTSLNIIDYVQALEQWSFDSRTRRWTLENEYYTYNELEGVCYLPKYDLPRFVKFLEDNHCHPVIIHEAPVEGAPAIFNMQDWVSYKNDKQKNCVEYVTNPNSGPLRGIALQTGSGKTVSLIWSLQKLQRRAVVTMTKRLEQWFKEILKYTDLTELNIRVVSGEPSLSKLFVNIEETNPSIILISAPTLKQYLQGSDNYKHLPPPSEFCKKLNIGIIATDEYHEHFHTNFLIGTMLNPSLLIPITATFNVSDKFVKNIFDQFIPHSVRFTGGEYERYTNVTAYRYTSFGYLLKPKHYTGPKGYSQSKFEQFLLGKGTIVLNALISDAFIPIIKTHYISICDPGEKFLFLCKTKALCDHLEKVFRFAFRDKTVKAFHSGMPQDILERYDMIISTDKSCGTGTDIKDLLTCFVFDNVSSENANLQYLGRLRKRPVEKTTPEFAYLYFKCIPKHELYATQRSLLYGNRAKEMRYRSLS